MSALWWCMNWMIATQRYDQCILGILLLDCCSVNVVPFIGKNLPKYSYGYIASWHSEQNMCH